MKDQRGHTVADDLAMVAIRAMSEPRPATLQDEVSGIVARIASGELSPWEGEVRIMFVVRREIEEARKGC